jgi:hypothetical protein
MNTSHVTNAFGPLDMRGLTEVVCYRTAVTVEPVQ